MLLQDVIDAYTNQPRLMMAVSAVPYIGGYVTWIYYYLLSARDRKMAIPIWLYTFWFAHDSTAAVVFYRLSESHDGFWFFRATSVALLVWTLVELGGMYLAVKYARQDIWGRYHPQPVTQRQAVGWLLAEIALMYAVIHAGRALMQDETMLKWFVLTNAVLAIGPFYLWRSRTDRQGSSIGLAIILVIVVGNTFLPPGLGMFTTASPSFDQPWFYACGAVFTVLAISNLVVLLRLPPKQSNDGRWQVW